MRQPILIPARRRTGVRADLVCAGAAALLVVAAFAVPRIRGEQWRRHVYAAAAPIFGHWQPHIGWGTGPAIAVAILVIVLGPVAARRLPWRRLLAATWATAVTWAFALAMVDGWQRGFAGRLTSGHEYLHEVGGVGDIGLMLRGFAGRILDFQPDSWTTHVSGHPPGALLVFVLLDRVGLGGGAWAAVVCVLVGCSAAVAVPVALDALGAPERARAVTPFLALAPAAIWIAVSADALFAGVTAWAVALLAIATRQRPGWPAVAVMSGLLFGFGLYLSYGLVLMAIPAAAVLLVRGFRPAVPALLGVAVVVAAFTAGGFWWLEGYHLVVQRYYQGIATERPYSYWVWGNLAATVCAVGLATAAALYRSGCALLPDRVAPDRETSETKGLGAYGGSGRDTRDGGGPRSGEVGNPAALRAGARGTRALPRTDACRADAPGDTARSTGLVDIVRALTRSAKVRVRLDHWRSGADPAAVLAMAGLAAILVADLSGLSKAETERIWLPFTVWLLAATAFLPLRHVRVWLAVQALAALLLNHLLLTNW
ncbi:hypothetical protein [Nocardia mexicana]|uniref:Integral membrane protein n=1 Tax=Nocardia mexicana TaxID=279262 RepID=A0A370H082_9NOCA|nr:hypothetical protein [Nocardia mexicana]RDI49330.1 hypothetical protein DFR68_107458 [Nocardia mexicana]